MPPNNDSYNSDELNAPQWLNTEFIREILVKHLKAPELKVVDVKFSPASSKGDHYASLMFRAYVEYETQKGHSTISLVIKTMPEQDGHKKELLGESHIFETEIAMYTKVLPKFEKVLREVGDMTRLCATCIYHSLKPRQVMVFEDLLTQGYAVIRRSANIEELRAALETLAKWHAVSHKLLKEQPELFDQLQYDITTLPKFLEQDFLTKSLGSFTDMLGNVESLKTYRKYFEPMQDKLIQAWVDVIREYRDNRQENGYYVLCHGDFHLRNMMFRGPDCMLLDFQMSYVGSMANDIIYAIYMLFDGKLREEKSNELIYNYFQTFVNTLKKIGYQGKVPSLVEFRRQMFEKRYNDFLLLTSFQPIIIYMRKGADPGEIIENDDLRSKLYYQKEYIKELEDLLPRMLHLGYFEPL
ncbi:uncharacterized protein [Drosophila virilis]|uniref:CHK kinase-like domain-containing protein n=1 Tax=Drosophila virilis TaxID=7244 RepID=B4LX75_DROVI|nr:uncharacterized protein LOC6630746 [Drosophila virilis]EDW66727.1 uncharacterized protein Dvir_GJ23763 [Drosophila virilis]